MNVTLDPNICPVIPVLDNRIQDAVTLFAEAAHRVIVEFCPDELYQSSVGATSELSSRRQNTACIVERHLSRNHWHHTVYRQGRLSGKSAGEAVRYRVDGVRRSKIVGFRNTIKSEVTINESLIEWGMFYNQSESTDIVNKPPISASAVFRVCGEDVRNTTSVTVLLDMCDVPYSNETVLPTRNDCARCPLFHWPDEQTRTSCPRIDPVYICITQMSYRYA